MRNKLLMAGVALILAIAFSAYAEDQPWRKGGPDYLYVKPLKKPQHHGVFDEGMKCLDCHAMTAWTPIPPPLWR